MKRVFFLGQKPIGQHAFFRLLERRVDGLEIVGVVSNVDCDNWWGDNLIYREARRLGLPFADNGRRNTEKIDELIKRQRADVLLSVQHPWILPEATIARVGGRAFNVHLAPLPDYKGWHGVNHAILSGRENYSISLHWMSAAVDSGDMAYAPEMAIRPWDTAASLYQRASDAGLLAIERLLDDLAAGRTPPQTPIVGDGAFIRPDLLDSYREVRDLSDKAQVDRVARSLYFPPFEPAFFRVGEQKIYLLPFHSLSHRTPFSK
ncbi:formyltransferase family protein [Ferruginivarius sediminum]|uniref:Formyl transferase N-terminal domain-containing protein n=1 Tax=Ferruginivarius sediminum TaxID=2661937 RepID=A0A369TE70_9PROT|nr:formyltransferase family protein [Ferruginivarius sediminum]RDD63568.1 hypothetical protein DRB17_03785 [Ferruginivarius sediminum]